MISIKKLIFSLVVMGSCLQFDFAFASDWGIPVPGVEVIETATPWMQTLSGVVRDNPKLAAVPVLCAVLLAGRNKMYQFSKNKCEETAKKIATKEQVVKSKLPVPVRMAYDWCRETTVSALYPMMASAWEYADHNKCYWLASLAALASGQVLIFVPGKFLAALFTVYGHVDMGSRMLQKEVNDFREESRASFATVNTNIANLAGEVVNQAARVCDKIKESEKKVIESVNQEIIVLSKQIAGVKSGLDTLGKDINGKVDGVGAKVDGLAKEIEEISQKIVESVKSIEQIGQKAEERDITVQNALKQIMGFADEFIDIKSKFDSALQQHVETNASLDAVKKTQEAQGDNIDQLLSDASEKTRLLAALQGSLEKVQQSEAHTLDKINEVIGQISKTGHELNILTKLQQSSNGGVVKLTENISLVENVVKEIQIACSSLFDRVGKVEAAVEVIMTDVSALKVGQEERKQKDEERDAEIKQLKQLLTDVLQQNGALKTQVLAMENVINKLSTNFDVLNRDMRAVGSQVSKDASATRQAVDGLSDKLNNFGKAQDVLAIEYSPKTDEKVITVPADSQIPSNFGKNFQRRPGGLAGRFNF